MRVEGDVIGSPETSYPFISTWQLLKQLSQNDELTSAATDQLDAMQELAPWLGATGVRPARGIHLVAQPDPVDLFTP